MFKKISLEQDTQEWLDWRSSGVGASDVRAVQGRCRYKTKWEIWSEKVGIIEPQDLSRNPNVRRGKRLEPSVRDAVAKILQSDLHVYCGEDDEKPWRKVSLDGVTDNGIPVEIKCPSISEDEDAFNRYQDLLDNGKNSILFQEYYPQCQYQIGMLNAPFGYLVFYFESNNQMLIFKVGANRQVIDQIFEDVDDFYLQHIQKAIEPEKDPDRDIYLPSELELGEWDSLTIDFLEATREETELNKALKLAREKKKQAATAILGKANNFKMLNLHGIKITLVKGREIFDYKKFIADNAIEIDDTAKEKYSKIGAPSIRLSASRNKSEIADVKNKAIQYQMALASELISDIPEEDLNALREASYEDEYFD